MTHLLKSNVDTEKLLFYSRKLLFPTFFYRALKLSIHICRKNDFEM